MGAAFDDDLIQSVAEVVSTEARAFNNYGRAGLDFWTPSELAEFLCQQTCQY
jgi:beta-D-xylosidase 4